MELTADMGYLDLLQQISDTYTQGRLRAVQAVNTHITQTYWQVGRQIVEFEQGGKARAEYGKALISKLARDLSLRHGKGFSRTNLVYMRLLYQRYPISQKPSDLSSWLCGTGSMIVRPIASVDADFLQRVLSSETVIAAIESSSVGSTMINLNQSTLSGLIIQAPPIVEQRAIATVLSDMDT